MPYNAEATASLRQGLEKTARGESLVNPSALSNNPHREVIARLRAGVLMLSKAPTPEDTIGVPTIIFDKKNASEAVMERTASGVRNTIYMYAEEERKGNIPTITDKQELPGLSITADAPHLGLNGKLERRIILEGDAEIVAAYTNKQFNIENQVDKNAAPQLTHIHSQTNKVIAA